MCVLTIAQKTPPPPSLSSKSSSDRVQRFERPSPTFTLSFAFAIVSALLDRSSYGLSSAPIALTSTAALSSSSSVNLRKPATSSLSAVGAIDLSNTLRHSASPLDLRLRTSSALRSQSRNSLRRPRKIQQPSRSVPNMDPSRREDAMSMSFRMRVGCWRRGCRWSLNYGGKA